MEKNIRRTIGLNNTQSGIDTMMGFAYDEMIENEIKKKTTDMKIRIASKTHIRYMLDGKRVPGVTTITGVMAKPALIKWANNLGLQGIDSYKYVDKLAGSGTLAHLMIQCFCTKEKPDTADFSKNQIDQASNSYQKFLDWIKARKFKTIENELQLVSKKGFGGTCDIYCNLDGKKTLIDVKTSKGVYPDQFTQVSAYAMLLEENKFPVEDVRILRVGRDESEGFEDIKVPNVELHKKRFLICLKLYTINKAVNKK